MDSCCITVGLIPAWAGKTRIRSWCAGAPWAHPRVGGENLLPCYEALKGYGSSPRGRGKLCDSGHQSNNARLIPAWAGKTRARGLRRQDGAAHPRVGGENAAWRQSAQVYSGSSPRGRGKLFFTSDSQGVLRLIPAWAGKTVGIGYSMWEWTAHPRVGGENFLT